MYRAYTEIALQWVTLIESFPILCAKFQFHFILSISDSCILIKAYSFAIDSIECHNALNLFRYA